MAPFSLEKKKQQSHDVTHILSSIPASDMRTRGTDVSCYRDACEDANTILSLSPFHCPLVRLINFFQDRMRRPPRHNTSRRSQTTAADIVAASHCRVRDHIFVPEYGMKWQSSFSVAVCADDGHENMGNRSSRYTLTGRLTF
jgi:hypothetical protein